MQRERYTALADRTKAEAKALASSRRLEAAQDQRENARKIPGSERVYLTARVRPDSHPWQPADATNLAGNGVPGKELAPESPVLHPSDY